LLNSFCWLVLLASSFARGSLLGGDHFGEKIALGLSTAAWRH